jgi:hypothetical protein
MAINFTTVVAKGSFKPRANRTDLVKANAAGVRVVDLIDLESTPVLILLRSKAVSLHRLAPGAFAAMPVRAAALPARGPRRL